MAAKRVGEEPAFILHRYDWSESSLILEVFTRHRGRVALVAKGAKKHTSNFRPVLLALQPLKVSYTLSGDGQADIHVLKGAEWAGGHIMPMGNNLLTGLYLNELLMRLLARDDPYAYLFDVYGAVVKLLATQPEEVIEPVLRAFELIVLRELGLLPTLHEETLTLQSLQPEALYVLVAEMGLRPALDSDRAALTGRQWGLLQQALSQGESAYPATVRACAAVATALKPQLRHLLQYHCGSPLLRTRQLMMDLQTL
ncbi:DNA repair protein RecO [Comamonas aquatica]|uniref:DNA repair protein RecO n=1 Tax=Comamonas aquatica TaxID=225991 RepID=UPI00244A4242|nr:DNA repair protein RecO [Comamonas aquatica]MDH0380301.1 DNA repair protein RecO [Comamonas aquatica]MDH0428321.1 DNA repair protein RecO [Comamonas aquatica]MDH0939676.1 DNA repair protein RecO [Comamonas aquatica]